MLLSQYYHYLRRPNLHVRRFLRFTFYFVYKESLYICFLLCMRDWTVAVAQHSTVNLLVKVYTNLYLKIWLYNNLNMFTYLTIFN
jgi:hypothetical protein